MAVALVAGVILLHKSDTQTIMAVIGFANGIVTGTFGLMVAGRRRRPPGQHHDAP